MASVNPEPLPQHSAFSPQHFHLTSLDRAVIVVIALLLLLIGATLVLGDHVGVQVTQATPLGQAHTTSPITIRFNETMNHDSAAAHFHMAPAVQGSFSWSGSTMTFQPSQALTPGSTYTFSIEPGALSDTGRGVLTQYQFSFKVMAERVAYMYPADSAPQNIWIVDPADPTHPKQLTNSPTGVVDFGVSPDGTEIAFTQGNPEAGTSDIYLIDLNTGRLQQLTNCANALCSTPVWRPDGKMIAYERIDLDPQFGPGPPRVWLIDLTATPATTQPLFKESEMLGYDVQWSADGNRIALMDRDASSIQVYDFKTGKIISISSQGADSGTFSPDGKTLIFSDMVSDSSGAMRNTMRIAQVDTGVVDSFGDPNTSGTDQSAQWSPDGKYVAIARAKDASASNTQIVIMDMVTKAVKALTNDPHYSDDFFWWDPTGTQLVVLRFPELDPNSQSNSNTKLEVWTIDVKTGAATKVAEDGFLPHWVP